jgi:glycerol-3-phosphate dehydrogenase (NAD(P)+)
MNKPQYGVAIVLGAGAFGTSMASVVAENFKLVLVHVRSDDIYQSLLNHENQIYLKGQKLAHNIIPFKDWRDVEKLNPLGLPVELIINGLPTSAIHSYFSGHQEVFNSFFSQEIPFVCLSKGIDAETLELSDDMLNYYFPKFMEQIYFLSGPSFASEILSKQITIVSLAGRFPDQLLKLSQMLQTEYFKAMPTHDIKGVLLGGALKNILAIAGGILEGLGYNHNTRAAMITRGITEMLRFGRVFNARPETFYSFAGMGDLILTTTSELSRNKTFGLEIAKGRLPLEIINSQRSVVEGYKTSLAAYRLSQKYHIRAQLFHGVYKILYENASPEEVIKSIMLMPVLSVE